LKELFRPKTTNISASRNFGYVFFFFIFFFSVTSFSQKNAVIFISGSERLFKSTFSYTSEKQLQDQLKTMQLSAYKKGFFAFSIDSIIQKDSSNTAVYGNFGEKITAIKIDINEATAAILSSLGLQPKTFKQEKADPEKIANLLETLLEKLENSGYPFAQVGFETLSYENMELKTRLKIVPNIRMKWTAIEVIGNSVKLSPKFITAYIGIHEGDWFNESVADLIAIRLKQLTYLKETKAHELLFTPDGVQLFLYLESRPVSSFNGTVGLQQNPVTLTYQLTGDLRLKLQNAFKKGELMELNWKSIAPGSPQLRLQTNIPYFLQTPFGIDGQFQLFKRDSTFLELKTGFGVSYFVSKGNTLKGFYRNYQSSLLGNQTNPLTGSVKSNQYGLAINHQTIDYLPNPRTGLIWMIEATAGTRKLTKDSIVSNSVIYTSKATFEWYRSLSKRIVLKTGLTAEGFDARAIQQNELMRFGGNNQQRGFLEDELLATSKITGTLEARFLLDLNSYFFAFFDQSWYERNTTSYLSDNPLGFGAGLTFGTGLGLFSITYALGKQMDNPILFRDSKIHFGYVAYF
jgi:hypothetical protein